MRLFLFRARHDDAYGCPLQRGAPTVGALGDAAMDENGRAMNRHFQVSWVYATFPSNMSHILKSFTLITFLFN